VRQTKAAGPPPGPSDIQLDTKNRPSQARSQDTYEAVLATAGQMLIHIGFEQLTTNGICEQAGLTPPALYRYFPNKYAVLKVLGERLMEAQDAQILEWIIAGGLQPTGLEDRAAKILAIQREIIAVTRRFPGGLAINRAVRAVPMLQRLHFESRDRIAERFLVTFKEQFPDVPEARLRIGTRLIAELSSAVTQMVVEGPLEDSDLLTSEASFLFALYFETLKSQ